MVLVGLLQRVVLTMVMEYPILEIYIYRGRKLGQLLEDQYPPTQHSPSCHPRKGIKVVGLMTLVINSDLKYTLDQDRNTSIALNEAESIALSDNIAPGVKRCSRYI